MGIVISQHRPPLKDSDAIRLYSGIHDKSVIADALTVGISGDRRIFRRYSYENNNNPRDIVSLNDVLVRYREAYPHLGKEEILDILGENPHYLKNVLMSDTRWNSVVRDMEKLGIRVDGGSQIGWG